MISPCGHVGIFPHPAVPDGRRCHSLYMTENYVFRNIPWMLLLFGALRPKTAKVRRVRPHRAPTRRYGAAEEAFNGPAMLPTGSFTALSLPLQKKFRHNF